MSWCVIAGKYIIILYILNLPDLRHLYVVSVILVQYVVSVLIVLYVVSVLIVLYVVSVLLVL